MRRSRVVQLTILPMLATAAIAAAEPAPDPPLAPPGMAEPPLAPPGMTEPSLAPPGMTPAIDDIACADDPSWDHRPDCHRDAHGVIRGGFGHYFHPSSG